MSELEDFKKELKELFVKHKIHSMYPNNAKSLHFIGRDIAEKFCVEGMIFVRIGKGKQRNYQIKE